ncbi:Cell division protein FtsZ [Burkholderia multivorans]|nr:Cell division protein FtsZ [Burkholderia multivorans]MDR8827546.1 Cell division protein FtsZ [Burkholderia multivorans]
MGSQSVLSDGHRQWHRLPAGRSGDGWRVVRGCDAGRQPRALRGGERGNSNRCHRRAGCVASLGDRQRRRTEGRCASCSAAGPAAASAGSLVRAVAAELSRSADAVVFVPESPHPSVLHCLVDACLMALRGAQPAASDWKMPTGSDFLDVREAFSGATGAVIGVGEGSGPERIKDAARQVILDVGSARLTMAGGLLVMVSGAETLRLREVAGAVYAICEATTGDAGSVLAAHYDDRLGETVRVTVIVAERDD